MGLAAGNAVAAATFLTTGDPTTAVAALGATTVLGGIQGAHMTASIGGMTPHLTTGLAPLHPRAPNWPKVQPSVWFKLLRFHAVTPAGLRLSPVVTG